MTKEEAKDYIEFMNNKDNSRRCENCPANEGCDSWQDKLPCGQWNCWVDVQRKVS